MNSPLVSICIPTYNRPSLLKSAILSCLNQAFHDFEIIITDNSDNEDSGRLVQNIADPRIRYFKNETNIGAHGNSARALSLANGKYVKWLMDDDLIKPQFLTLAGASQSRGLVGSHGNRGNPAPFSLARRTRGGIVLPDFGGCRNRLGVGGEIWDFTGGNQIHPTGRSSGFALYSRFYD